VGESPISQNNGLHLKKEKKTKRGKKPSAKKGATKVNTIPANEEASDTAKETGDRQ